MKKTILIRVSSAFAIFCLAFVAVNSLNAFERTVNCLKSSEECIRITLGNETHIYPGTEKAETIQ